MTVAAFLVELFLAIILHPFDKKRKIVHAQCYWWASSIIRLNPFWKLSVNGLENIDPNKTYVVIANHQSLADIVVMYKTHMQFKWVAKDSVFKIPCIGSMLYLGKHIKLLRGNFSSIKKAYRDATRWLKNDISVVFFPEGTRSTTDKLNSFQNGAFKLAIREKKPILPIAINGTREAIPKGGWIFKTNVNVDLTVLPPIDTAGFHIGDFALLRNMAQTKLADALAKI